MEWIKIMCNILDHRKIKMIRKGPEGNTLVLLWLLMLTEAGKSNRAGYLMVADKLPYTPETLSMVTDIPLPTVQMGLTIFTRFDMIDQEDGAVFIKNWGKYQSQDKLDARREKDKLRQAKHRDKVRGKICELPASDHVSRDSHVSTPRDVTLQNRIEKNRVDENKNRLKLSEREMSQAWTNNWESLNEDEREEYLSKALLQVSPEIDLPPQAVNAIAKSLAWNAQYEVR